MKKRQSNFELLRIIAMMMIILHHSMVHGTLDVSRATVFRGNPFSLALFCILAFGGKVGVYIFSLITGYFMLYSRISVKKLVKLWLPIFFWSVILTVVFDTMSGHFSLIKLVESAFPIIFNQYWFMTAYLFTYLLAPILNKMVLSLDMKLEILLVSISLVMIALLDKMYGSVIYSPSLSLIVPYLFGALIRKHDLLKKRLFNKIGFKLLVLGIIVNIVLSVTGSFLFLYLHSSLVLRIIHLASSGFRIIGVLTAVGLFTWIGSKNVSYNKFINVVASTTFGIYLIHDNNSVRPFIWHTIFHTENMILKPPYFLFNILLICLLVFIVCSFMEYVRKALFGKFENQLADRAEKAYHTLISSLVSSKFIKD